MKIRNRRHAEDAEDSALVMIRPGSNLRAAAPEPATRPRFDLAHFGRVVLSASIPPLLVLAWGWAELRETRRHTATLQVLERQLSASGWTTRQLRDLREREKDLGAALERFRQMDRHRQVALRLIQTLQRSISSTRSVWLSRVHLAPSGLQIRGRCRAADKVWTLIEALERSPLLHQVRLRQRLRHSETGVWEFELQSEVAVP